MANNLVNKYHNCQNHDSQNYNLQSFNLQNANLQRGTFFLSYNTYTITPLGHTSLQAPQLVHFS